MICRFCGRTIVDDAMFCSYCGKKVAADILSIQVKCYRIFKSYLEELVPDGIELNRYFNPQKKNSLEEVVYQFACNLQDYNMMPSVIGFMREDRNPVFRRILFDYNHNLIINSYTSNMLYAQFCEHFPVKNKDSKQNSWLKYSKGIISACEYLAKFQDINAFNDYVDSFNGSFEIIAEFQKEIYGLGFALACNMVKDLGFTNYAKPDTHTKDVIMVTGLSGSDEISVVRAIQSIAAANNDTAFNVDRMIWLICSGYYFLDDVRVKSHKRELIERIKNIL